MADDSDRRRPGVLVAGPNPPRHVSTRRMTWWRRLVHTVGAPLAVGFIRLLWATYRFRVEGDGPLREEIAAGRPVILTFWHDSIFAMSWYLRVLAREGARVTYLVSPSIDGEFGVRMLGVLGARSVRGSATRSGVKALRGLYRAITRDGGSPVVLPDGPTGPRHDCKAGSVLLAQMSGRPIVPMALAPRRAWQLPTWDRMMLPWPGTKVRVLVGQPYTVPRELDEAELEGARLDLQQRLDTLNGSHEAPASG